MLQPPQNNLFIMPFAEFVALIALMMALTARSIDVMLAALPDIGASLGVAEANRRQLALSFCCGACDGADYGAGRISAAEQAAPAAAAGLRPLSASMM